MNEIGRALELCIWYSPQISMVCGIGIPVIIITKAAYGMAKMILRKLKTGHFTPITYQLRRG